jgi:hypothetical protein
MSYRVSKIPAIAAIVILVLGSFGRWPYGFYTLLRFVVCLSAIYLALAARRQNRGILMRLMIGSAILFNPAIPVTLNRSNWRVIDFIAAALFAVSVPAIRLKSNSHESNEVGGTDEIPGPTEPQESIRETEHGLAVRQIAVTSSVILGAENVVGSTLVSPKKGRLFAWLTTFLTVLICCLSLISYTAVRKVKRLESGIQNVNHFIDSELRIPTVPVGKLRPVYPQSQSENMPPALSPQQAQQAELTRRIEGLQTIREMFSKLN